jgi:Protein of unknown function (DUF551)
VRQGATTVYNGPMWIATAERLPSPGQKVFFTNGPIVYRASFQPCQVRPSDDGPLWISISGRRVTHWMPAEECPDGVPALPS